MLSISRVAALLSLLTTSVVAAPVASSIPTPRNSVYVQTFTTTQGGQLSLLPLIQNKVGITHIELASLHINDDPKDIHLNNNNPNSSVYDNVWKEVAQIQKTGVKVLFMLGGFGVLDYAKLCNGKNTNNPLNMTYYEPLRQTIAFHKIQGLDLDIEESSTQQCPLSLLRQLDKDFGSDFILTMSPVANALFPGGVGFGNIDYKALDTSATSSTRPNGKLVNYYNCQFYNGFGDAGSTNDYDTIVNNGFIPARITAGILDASADGNQGWKPIATYSSTIKALRAKYPTFGGTIGWEYFNAGQDDKLANPWQWVQAIGKALGVVTRKLRRSLNL